MISIFSKAKFTLILFCLAQIITNNAWARPSSAEKEWNVFIYMAADNDLTPYAWWDLYEMERSMKGQKNLGATSDLVNVVVELDTIERDGLHRFLIEGQSDVFYDQNLKIEDFKKSGQELILSPEVMRLPETGEGAKRSQRERFQDFLTWGLKNYKAKRNMIIIWGHGQGHIGPHQEDHLRIENFNHNSNASSRYLDLDMVSAQALNREQLPYQFPLRKVFGGVAFDHSDFSYLDIPTISDILSKLQKRFLKNNKFNLLAFDACLMQSIEVIDTLKNNAEFIVGSVQIQDYLGLPYRMILDELNSKPIAEGYDMAKSIPDLVGKAFSPQGYQALSNPLSAPTYTVSSYSTHEHQYAVLPGIAQTQKAIQEYIDEIPERELEILFILQNSPAFLGEGRDIGIFLGNLKRLLYQEKLQEGQLTPKALQLNQSIDDLLSALSLAIINYSYGELYINPEFAGLNLKNQYLLGFFKGLSIWIPAQEELYFAREKEFHDLPWLYRPKAYDEAQDKMTYDLFNRPSSFHRQSLQ